MPGPTFVTGMVMKESIPNFDMSLALMYLCVLCREKMAFDTLASIFSDIAECAPCIRAQSS